MNNFDLDYYREQQVLNELADEYAKVQSLQNEALEIAERQGSGFEKCWDDVRTSVIENKLSELGY